MDRRAFVKGSALAAGVTLFSRDFWRTALAAVEPGPGPYGAVGVADANGVQLPPGFSSRVIARSGLPVGATAYVWPGAPDGGACFPVAGGGWVYAANSELDAGAGGVSAVKFAANGSIVDAYRILANTRRNCAGGLTPWGTWLSCEEVSNGHVFECNPQAASQGIERPLLGTFNHEAACVDPNTGIVYLTEDDLAGRLYRFVPTTYGDLSAGQLQAAKVDGTNVTWVNVVSTAPAPRDATTTAFARGEGMWMGAGAVYFSTTADFRIWELTTATNQIRALYDGNTNPLFPLHWPDNLTVHRPSGDLFVCEDGDNMELCIIANMNGVQHCAVFARWSHLASELAGVAFSPDGSRVYISSQRGNDGNGITYEITGPFRTEETLVPFAGTWRYLDTGIAPAAWTERTFDDSTWKTGAAPLGYGDAIATTIGFGTDPNNKHITSLFRHAFTATHGYTALTLRLRRDDGAVVYINGAEVARSNMPAGAIGASTLAATTVAGTGETAVIDIPITATLYSGPNANVIAVEVHQSAANSSDLAFDLALVGTGDTGALAAPPGPARPAGASQFTSVAPFRVLDTRIGLGAPAAKPGQGAILEVNVIGGVIPANATAIVLNVTGTEATADGFLTVFPTGEARPLAANQNLVAGQTRGNLVTAKIGSGGRVSIYTQSGTHLVADVFGYYAPPSSAAGRFTPLPPARLLDTRRTGSKVSGGGSVDVQVTGAGGVPTTGVAAVVVNITATEPDEAGFVTGHATGSARPFTSNLNIDRAGQTIGNLAILPVGTGGKITLYSLRSTHLIVDVAGWYGDDSGTATDRGLFIPVSPVRLLDTRDPGRAKLSPGGSTDLVVAGNGGVPAAGAAGIIANVTMVEVTAPGFLTIYPAGQTRQEVSSLYADTTGMIIPSLVASQLGGSPGAVTIYSNAGSHVVLDLAGWFTA